MQLVVMATYAIGDIQGCYRTVKRLLKKIAFDSQRDRLFLVGDLVNRGQDSLDVLRFVHDLGDRAITVLGNHDIHLIAMALEVNGLKRYRILEPVLTASDAPKLISWLRNRPILYREDNSLLVHAGILPAWKLSQAEKRARKIEELIRGDGCQKFLSYFYSSLANNWDERLSGMEKSAVALNSFVRMRMCRSQNEMDFVFTGNPDDAPKGLTPWFQMKNRPLANHQIIFGHWAALGLRISPEIASLDSGCVWGQFLTAYRLDDGALFFEQSAET